MDVNRIYLLIILVLSPNVSRMSHSIKCHRRSLELFVKRTLDTKRIAEQCTSSNVTSVTLPNVEIRVAVWRNMTVPQQTDEVLSQLHLLSNATQEANASDCISFQLQKLNSNIKQITGLIYKFLKTDKNNTLLQDVSVSQVLSFLTNTTTDGTDIIRRYLKLLHGKVTLLLQSLRRMSCR
uniref:Uncharacterized protein n=1 Tax=Leptobrachium leishanense TaxID=445787 RepID=A0A8C5PH94_9ANUR